KRCIRGFGLLHAGFVVDRNLTIEYRFAEGKYDRLSLLAAELVHRQAAQIVALNKPAARAATAASATVPAVFSASDVRAAKLWEYINSTDLAAKQFELLRELVQKPPASGCSSILTIPLQRR